MSAAPTEATGGRPCAPPPVFTAIPDELQRRVQWVLWRFEDRDGKVRKVPYQPSGRRADTTKRRTWSAYEEVVAVYDRGGFDGIGFVFADDDPYAGVDLDGCRDPETGAIEGWAWEWIEEFDTYAEVSPSGTGVHLIGRGRVPKGRRAGKIEAYSEGRYFTVTGEIIESCPPIVADAHDALERLCAHLDEVQGRSANGHTDDGPAVDWDGAADLAQIREKLAKLMKRSAKFRRTWNHQRDDLPDQSPSSYDQSLASIAARAGWSDTEVFLLIRAHREKLGSAKWARADYIDRTVARAQAAARSTAPEASEKGPTAVPVIQLQAGAVSAVTRAAIEALQRAGVGIYDRGGALYRPVTVDSDERRGGVTRTRGAVVLLPVVAEWVELRLAEVATWEKFDGRSGDWRRTDPPAKVAVLIVKAPDEGRWPYLSAVVQHPVLLPDGRMLAASGYDPETKMLLDVDGGDWPAVPAAPSKADAEAARNRLEELLRHFPWASAKAQAVGLSLLLTSVARPALPTAPLHAVDAPEAGTGKSLLVDAAAILATGAPASVMEYSRDPTENAKRLDAMLLAGDPFIAIDNVDAPLEGATLCQTLSQERRKVRVLGSSAEPTVACRAFVTATGNNLVLRGDIVRRALVCRLDARMERPEIRRIDQDLLAEVAARRGELVRDCQTIMFAYIRAGRPDVGLPPLGSFDQWSRMVRAALVWAGAADPVGTIDETRKGDPSRLALQAVLSAWSDAYGDDAVTAAAAVELAEHDPGLKEALGQVALRRGQLDARVLGYWLRAHRDARAGDLVLRAAGVTRTGIQTWRVAAGDAEDAGDVSSVRGKTVREEGVKGVTDSIGEQGTSPAIPGIPCTPAPEDDGVVCPRCRDQGCRWCERGERDG